MPDLREKKSPRGRMWQDMPTLEPWNLQESPRAIGSKELYIEVRKLLSKNKFIANTGRAVRQLVDEYLSQESAAQRYETWIEDCPISETVAEIGQFEQSSVRRKPVDVNREGSSARDNFLDRARRLERRGRINSAPDVVYNHVDEMLLAGKFAELDERLRSIDCDMFSVDLLLAVLTITYAAKSHLPQRTYFYRRVEQSIRARREWDDGLLFGLD